MPAPAQGPRRWLQPLVNSRKILLQRASARCPNYASRPKRAQATGDHRIRAAMSRGRTLRQRQVCLRSRSDIRARRRDRSLIRRSTVRQLADRLLTYPRKRLSLDSVVIAGGSRSAPARMCSPRRLVLCLKLPVCLCNYYEQQLSLSFEFCASPSTAHCITCILLY